ncbi:hypothetical protein VB715_21250 [Crocosphaera sp. UHCC 0190]|uniref:hypothetical protein n=1 Tax=Crocosphaera sp. UHCC 0190 TaxID=3110246 RepID=UPI002B2011D8|nr:hypothetical protein [Crocosphaera sp. UHCC 0190]MEA5512303.1 hypothetical protein [Crocosphaera sp. UHCC 0190]
MAKNRFENLSKALKGESLPEQVENISSDTQVESSFLKKRGGKRSDPNFVQVGVYVPKELHLKVKKLLLDQPDKDMSDLVSELMADWVEQQED